MIMNENVLTTSENLDIALNYFDGIASKIMNILRTEYSAGRITGEQYVLSFNSVISTITQASLTLNRQYFENIIKLKQFNKMVDFETEELENLKLQNDKIETEINVLKIKTELEEAMTKSNILVNNSKIDAIYFDNQVKAVSLQSDVEFKEKSLALEKAKTLNGVTNQKSSVLAQMIKSQLDAWAIMLTSGYLVDDNGNQIIPDFVKNSSINDYVSNLESQLTEETNIDVDVTMSDFTLEVPQRPECSSIDTTTNCSLSLINDLNDLDNNQS